VAFFHLLRRLSYWKIMPDIQIYQFLSCFRPIFGPVRHVEQSGKKTLAHIFRDMHDIKAMRRTEDMPVRQVPKHVLPFPYPQ
jgi:hypothetical protein